MEVLRPKPLQTHPGDQVVPWARRQLELAGTIPAAILGVYFETRIKSLFASPYVAAGFLIVNGILLLGFEMLRRRAERRAALHTKTRAEQEQSFAPAER